MRHSHEESPVAIVLGLELDGQSHTEQSECQKKAVQPSVECVIPGILEDAALVFRATAPLAS